MGQINQCQNPLEDLNNYVCKPDKIKIFRSKYDTVTGEFLGLFETLGYLTVRGDESKCFLDYGYSKDNSKILYGNYKMRIPNSFSGSMFNKHWIQYESGTFLGNDFSNTCFLLLRTSDRPEKINYYMGSVNFFPIDIPEKSFEVEGNVEFGPSKFDSNNPEKEKMKEAVLKQSRKVGDFSNGNIKKNANTLLEMKPANKYIQWMGGERMPEGRFFFFFFFFFFLYSL